jgi:hypothetical protein
MSTWLNRGASGGLAGAPQDRSQQPIQQTASHTEIRTPPRAWPPSARMRPNPSIERTCSSGLRPASACRSCQTLGAKEVHRVHRQAVAPHPGCSRGLRRLRPIYEDVRRGKAASIPAVSAFRHCAITGHSQRRLVSQPGSFRTRSLASCNAARGSERDVAGLTRVCTARQGWGTIHLCTRPCSCWRLKQSD